MLLASIGIFGVVLLLTYSMQGILGFADFSALSAGRPPRTVYHLTARPATALQTVEPGGAIAWPFAGEMPRPTPTRPPDSPLGQPVSR